MTPQRPSAPPPTSGPLPARQEQQRIFPPVFGGLAKLPGWLGVLMACAFVEAALQTFGPSIAGASLPAATLSLAIAPTAIKATLDAAGRRPWRFPTIDPTAPIWLAGGLCLLVGWLAGTFWPNSGDEHSYVFLADTLLAGRLTNPPAPDPELFALFRVFTMRGQTFSQYLPGWPLVLAPFRFAGLEWLANPLLTVLLGWCLLGAMRCLRVAAAVQPVMLLMVLMTPFVLFNGASLFSSTLSAAFAAAIVWQQLLDEQQPTAWRKALIGALFGGELLARPEVFLVLATLYAGDRLCNRRAAALRDAAPMLLGALPFVAFFFWYDWVITGNPLETPVTLTNPDITLGEAVASPWVMFRRAASHLGYWAGSLEQFGGLALMVLQTPALARKMRRGSLRFFDLAPPAIIAFFLFFPNDGGHQYGPRYWFPAWPLAALTVATGLLEPEGAFRLGGMRFSFDRLTAANLAFCAAVLPGLIVTTRVYIDARREALADPVPAKPAVVLVPTRQLTLWPWQAVRLEADSLDFARDDVNFSGPVLYGRLDAPNAVARACRLSGRTVFVWRGPGNLARSDCPREAR